MKFFSHKKNIYWLALGFVCCLVVLSLGLLATPVSAQEAGADVFGVGDVEQAINLTGGDIRVTIANIIRTVLGLLGIIAVLIVLYGGYTYMTAGGNEEKISRAKKILINGVIGLVIILSAFTIVQFVINRLTEALQPGEGGGDTPSSVCDFTSPDYDALLCQELCQSNPNLSVCKDLAFYVKSITPSTLGAEATGMNNIVVRVLFSHPLAADTDLSTALSIENDSGDQLVPLTVERREAGKLLEAIYANDGGHIPLQNYTIEINEDLFDTEGNGLIGDYGFGGLSFPLAAGMSVDQAVDDAVPPQIDPIQINGQASTETVLYKGDAFTLETVVRDVTEQAPFGGVGLVRVTIEQSGTGEIIEGYLDAPLVEDGSSAPFAVLYTSLISSAFEPLTQYTAKVQAYDIDHNSTIAQTSFVVQGAHCSNGVQDGDETDVDAGGSCGGVAGDSCSTDADCAGTLTCGIDNVCAAYPVIGNVDPMDGAAGNWITVSGANFGENIGLIQFAVDGNGSGVYEDNEWVDAIIPECTAPGASSWNKTYVIAEVTGAFAPGSLSSIRIIPDQDPAPSLAKIIDGSAILDGADDVIRFDAGPTYVAGQAHDFSLSAWIMTESTDGRQVIASGGLNDNDGWVLFIEDGILHVQVSSSGGWLRAEAPYLSDFLGKYSHVAAVYDESTENLRLFLNGQSYDGFANQLFTTSRGNYLNIGGERSIGESYYFGGSIDEFALYNIALSPATVEAQYSIGLGGSAVQYHQQITLNNPVAYFHLNELQGAVALNEVGNSPDGVYENGAGVSDSGIFFNKSHAILVNGIPTLADLTTNDIGPKPGTQSGLFEHNTTNRPGLCSVATSEQIILEPEEGGDTVIIPVGATAAPSGTALEAAGVGFGTDGNISFGGIVNAPVTGWSESLIETEVPENMVPGTVAVAVTTSGETSNGIPFTIMDDVEPADAPVISAIDPAATTAGSFITIYGDGFDGSGSVYIADTAENVQTCDGIDAEGFFDPLIPHASCVALNVSALPAYCGDTWGNTQVIAEIPENTDVGVYAVLLKNGFSLKTNGQDTLEVVDGPPRPSICLLDPGSGPAPLPEETKDLHIRGVHFSAGPEVYFSTKGTIADNLSTWLSSLFDTVFGNPVVTNKNDTDIMTRIPVGDVGYSMVEGPGQIKVQSDTGELSNSVTYTVADCRDQPQGATPGYQCCTTGPDAGSLVPEFLACEGETRDAGYVWRFTTGLIPQIPEVVEECNEIDPPSPSPFGERVDGNNACLNAELSVRFTMDMDPASFADNVALYTCGSGAQPDCENKVSADILSPQVYSSKRLIIRSTSGLSELEPNTWYRVELSEDIQSKELATEFGQQVEKNQFLKQTRPCGEGAAYCFEFKTGSGLCKLEDVGIYPSVFTTPLLGLLHSPVYSAETEDILYYNLWGKADQSCITIPVDGQGWEWTVDDPTSASVTVSPDAPVFTDSRATASALAHTAPEHVEISASADIPTDVEGATNVFTGTSDLFIDLADPEAVYREPECSASCINGRIQADFNRHMAVETYSKGFHLYECLSLQDPNCTQTEEIFLTLGEFEQSTPFRLIVQPSDYLKPNTRYKVVLTEDIKALGRLDPPIIGKSLIPTEWFFKTKDDPTPCVTNEIKVIPDPFVAYQIGQKTPYLAQPYSSPNECNPNGQALNPHEETYTWDTDDLNVAKVTNFNTSYGSENFCTAACLPKGSNVPRAVPAEELTLCGNGVINTGEDCDIGIDGSAGADCTLNCLRPGNQTAGCGNGIVEPGDGELCDPTDPQTGDFCTNECLLLGSVAETAAGACGNGILELNEACDTGLTLTQALAQGLSPNASQVGCTNECLHVGTAPIAYWCDVYLELDGCTASFSVCGNGFLEKGEECEVGKNGATEETCTDRCLLQNVCETPLAECAVGQEGCNDDCTLAGASLGYSEPSVCGDGVPGIGEFAGGYSCEGSVADPSAGSGPQQIVSAVGEGDLNAEGAQQTLVNASLVEDPNIVGSGEYVLQCGFTEFPPAEVENSLFNDCPNNTENTFGVASNSCCMARPTRMQEYPQDGAGFGGEEKVCRNTYIEAVFDREIREDSIAGNILLATGHTDPNYDCATEGGQDSTALVEQSLIAFAHENPPAGLLQQIWQKIKTFFVRLFGGEANATAFDTSLSDISVWCSGATPVSPDIITSYLPDGTVDTSKITIQIGEILDPDTTYAVLLRGGAAGITDTLGVGIKNADNSSINDMWVFETGDQVCKIKDVVVSPDSHIFQTPLSSRVFEALTVGDFGDQMIVPTPGYSWEWSWGPQNNPIFAIPFEETSVDSPTITIGATNIPGTLTAVASAHITMDIDQTNNQTNQTFYGTTDLVSLFCENPWPAFDENNEWQSFEDNAFNFRMSYCADAGVAGNEVDDLPFLEQVVVSEFTAPEPTIEVPITTIVPGTCSLHPEQQCVVDEECPTVYNMPWSNTNTNTTPYDADCHFSLSLEELLANGCTLTDLPTGKYCKTNQYPPQYGETYRSCNTNVDCNPDENCVTAAAPAWKHDTSCVGVSEIEVPPVGSGDPTAALAEDTLQKSFFFNEQNDDAIGLQIFKNAGRLSAEEWFIDKFGSAASFQQVNVGGYDAVTDGNNFYINGLNKPDVENPETAVFSNIYLLGINKDAQSATRDVFQQILNSLEFNINFTDYGYCLSDSATADLYASPEDYDGTLTCTTDFDCLDPGGNPLAGTSGICSNVKTKFFRDWDRLHDVSSMQSVLASNAPNLAAGTYIPNYTVSRWPSWNSLGGLPLDTLNDWTACGVDDQQTCWDANNFVYMCPAIASVYEYSYDTVANTYQVHIPFEYFTDEAALEQEFDEFILNPDAFTTDRSCVGQTLSPFGGVCGDGTVNPGEECDPPGSSGFISGICQANEIAPAVCGTSCTWEFGACQPAFQCGNGVVEAGENCDDGSFNGSYGHCANDCQGPSAQFCGNSIKDDPNEFCDWSASPWADQSGVSPYYATNQTDSCAADCLSTGSYCGDGILQASEGEACDDGNTASGDGCSPSCKEENLACFNQNPQYYKGQIVGTEQLHYFFLTRVDPADFSDFVAFHDANPGDLGPFYPGTSHINQCLVGSNCNEICGTAGLFCEGMYEVKKSVNFPGQSTWSPLVKSLDLSQKFENSPADRVYVAACSGQYTPPAAPSSVPLGELACGNGIVENETTHPDADPSQWEACDLGDQNGIACTPGYGEGCSYCSANCQNVITIDPVEYCGNGQIDVVKSIITPPPIVGVFYELEACDIDTSGNVYQGSDSVVQNIFPFLTDLNNAGSISCPDKGTYQCTNSCTELDDSGCVTCGVTFDNTKPAPKLGLINPMIRYANPDNPDNWPIDFVAGLFRSKETGGNISYDYFGFFGHAEEPGTTPPIPEEKNPFLDTEGSLNEKMGIESDLQCNGEYTTIFFPSLPALVGFVFNPDIGLKLPYPVDGETAEVYNEYVYNPVVPEGVYRAVVRWSATDGTSNNFVGGVYTEENTSDPNISYADAGPDSDGTTAYCSSIVQNAEKYWMPAAGPSDICTKYADAVYVHPQNGLENTFIQSFTIDTATADSDFGFYVQAIGFDRIANYKFTDLVVELYEYHDGQDPENFIFEPVYTFRIQDSAGTSSNPTAKYWHVFNLEKNLVTNEYEVVPVKSIETDECQLKAGIPDAYLGNCEPE